MYQVQSLYFEGSLTDGDIERHMCSDRIWLPRTVFETFLGTQEAGAVLVLSLTNEVEQTVVGTPFGYHRNDANIIYAPQWILDALEYDHANIRLKRFTPSLCSRISIIPFSSEHIAAEDPQIYFRDAFESYTCIQRGLTLPLFCNGRTVTIAIQDVIPNNDEPLCIRDVELELELSRPLDRPPTPEITVPVQEPQTEVTEVTIPANFIEPTIQMPSRDEVRRLCAAAALRRLKESQ